jgi:hypothetical protein
MSAEDVFFWDAVVDRARSTPEEARESLAQRIEQAVGPDKALYVGDLIAGWDGTHRQSADPDHHAMPYGQLLHSPEMAWHIANLGALARLRTSYPDALREWKSQVFYVDLGISYHQVRHIPDGLSVGVRAEAIEALQEGREWDLTEEEQLLTDFIRRVLNRTMTAETWNAMQERLGETGVVEYAISICVQWLVSTLTRALNFYPEVERKQLDKMFEEYKTGRKPLPDWKARQPDTWMSEWGARGLVRNQSAET